jgi:hypothetical protein
MQAKQRSLRKRRTRANGAVAVDLSDPRHAHLREQLTNATVLSPEDSAAVLRWIETGKERPPCV